MAEERGFERSENKRARDMPRLHHKRDARSMRAHSEMICALDEIKKYWFVAVSLNTETPWMSACPSTMDEEHSINGVRHSIELFKAIRNSRGIIYEGA